MRNNSNSLGKILRQQRNMISMPLHEVATKSGVSASHLCRIETGERFPSARVLHKIAKPLGFEDSELLTLVGYLVQEPSAHTSSDAGNYHVKRLDSYVASVLAQEPLETQYAVLPILKVLHKLSQGTAGKDSTPEEKKVRSKHKRKQ